MKKLDISGLCFEKIMKSNLTLLLGNLILKSTAWSSWVFFGKKEALQYGYYTPNREAVYGCTFCQNAAVKEEIDNKGKSDLNFIQLADDDYLEHIKKLWSVKNFYFTDSILQLTKHIWKIFYRNIKKIKYFICATRMNLIDDEIAFL